MTRDERRQCRPHPTAHGLHYELGLAPRVGRKNGIDMIRDGLDSARVALLCVCQGAWLLNGMQVVKQQSSE